MSFGLSISDFRVAFDVVASLRRCFVHAPAEFAAVSVEVRALSSAFRDIDDLLEEVEIPPEQQRLLWELAESCSADLQGLQKILDKSTLTTSGEDRSDRVRRAWRRINWPRGKIDAYQKRLSQHALSLNTFLAKQTAQTVLNIQRNMIAITADREIQHKNAILQWLSPLDFRSQQHDLFSLRQKKYGRWFLDSSAYKAFVTKKGGSLFCYGVPGTGKTLISATVIDHLEKHFAETNSDGLAYIYCSYQLQQEQQPGDLLRCIFKQFVERLPKIPHPVYELYHNNRNRRRPTSQQILTHLPIILQEFNRSFIVLDALDEFHDANNGTEKFLAHIFNLQSLVQVNLLTTSRPVIRIEQQFKHCPKKEIRAQTKDIKYYIEDRMNQLQRPLICDHPDVAAAAVNNVTAAADGMFLLARLHMDTIMRQPTLGDLKRAIHALPQGAEGLDQTYDEAMARIRAQEDSTQRLAESLLAWSTFAWRALTSAEVQHALSIRPGMNKFDNDFVPDTSFLGSICAGLIEIDKESGIVRLVHHTTREYLIRKNVFPDAMLDIARSCLTYILFDDFASGPCHNAESLTSRLNRYPLYPYAASFWSYHAREANPQVRELELRFLQDRKKLLASVEVIDALEGTKGFTLPSLGESDLTEIENIHVSAGFGLFKSTSMIIESGVNPDLRDAKRQTPLIWAAANGHTTTMANLLALSGDKVDLNARDELNMTPLCHAAQRGHLDAVRMLLDFEQIDLEAEDRRGRTAILLAAAGGHEPVAQLFTLDTIKHDVNLWKADNVSRNVLHYAAMLGMTNLLEILAPIAPRQDLDAVSINGYTPLLYAAENAHPEAIEILLQERANAKHRNEDGNGCLHLALNPPLLVMNTFESLLKHADVDAPNNIGQTPLHHAVTAPWLDHFKALIKHHANILAEDKSGRNVMHFASSGCNHIRLGEFLKIPKVKAANLIATTDLKGRNALHHALDLRYSAVNNAKVLLSYGVDPNHLDKSGNSPLSTYIQASIFPIDLNLCRSLLGQQAVSWGDEDFQKLAAIIATTPHGSNEALLELLLSYTGGFQEADL